MKAGIGLICTIAGLFQLLCNEWSVELKRHYKPWWRANDANTDRQQKQILRVTTFVSGVIFFELGMFLTSLAVPPLARVAWYGACGLMVFRAVRRAVGS